LTELSNEEMAARYRFANEEVDVLEDLLLEDLERATKRNKTLTVRAMILITLRFLTTGAFFNVVGDSIGYNKCTVSRVVAHVTDVHLHETEAIRGLAEPRGEEAIHGSLL